MERRGFDEKAQDTRFFLTALFLLLAACQSNEQQATEKTAVPELPSSKEGITVTTEKEQYTTSDKEIKILIQNDSDVKLTYGLVFSIEKKVNGT